MTSYSMAAGRRKPLLEGMPIALIEPARSECLDMAALEEGFSS